MILFVYLIIKKNCTVDRTSLAENWNKYVHTGGFMRAGGRGRGGLI